ncbi:hypothetical protein [Hyphomicrobium sp. MC1]|uniref:hypothetical protein n=1 Tax=Hyphomicrobium sp. (strain MC1) TaxID=717785 RepID=UPI000213E45B|nr:hypothetical protein [Hyphomicrobium sp. MC1]CCB66513.1 conserved protein of unknown function [Hyphomicrobium sp. MC1]
MLERTMRKLVTFQRPFLLPGFEEPLGPGTYTVDTTEELIEGLSFVAYRRVSTTIETAIKGFGRSPF